MNGDWETRVQRSAKTFVYPPTPDIAATLYRRRRRTNRVRLAQVVALLLILLLALTIAVPQIRAQVIAFFHIGAVEVVVTTATPPARFAPGDLPSSVLDFPGATTLVDAEQHFGHPVLLPTALGAPDRVYLIDTTTPIVVLAWLDTHGAVDVSLQLLPPDAYVLKMTNGTPQQTQVNGADAVWLPDTHWYMLKITPDAYTMRSVDSPALIWDAANGVTYRLETHRSLADALKIADSIPTQ